MSEDDLMVVSCPTCRQRFRVRPQSAGRAVKCPHCAQPVAVPHANESSPKTASPAPASPTAVAPSPSQAEFQLGPPTPRPTAKKAPQTQPTQAPFDPQQQAEANPFQAPALDLTSASISGLPVKRRYPALQIIRMIYLVMACLVVLGWVLFMAGTLVIAAQAGAVGLWFRASLIPTVGAAVAATMLVAVAEMIKLALDVQANTLATARATTGRSQ